MDINYLKSSSDFSFNFGGSDEGIFIETFFQTMQNVVDALQIITINEDPSAQFKLKISRTHPGSFIVDMQAVMSVLPTIVNAETLDFAKKIIDIFLGVFQIKKALKGDKPKKVEYKEKEAIITTQEEQQIVVPESTAKVYFQNNKMDNTIINIFNIISEDKERSSITITQDNKEKVRIEKEEFKHMTKRAIPEVIETARVWKNVTSADLLLRKPDLLGNSRWGFYLNKNIDATIADTEWLNEVHKGKVKNLFAGVRIPVKMEIEVDMDKDNMPIKDSERYSIIEITGDVIEPKSYEQMDIF